MFLRTLLQSQRRRADSQPVPVIRGTIKFKNPLVCFRSLVVFPETAHHCIIPKGTESHDPVGNQHPAERPADNECLKRYLALPGSLRTAGINQHIHHKIRAVPPELPFKQFPAVRPSYLPKPVRNNFPIFPQAHLALAPKQKRTFQSIPQQINIPLCHPVILPPGTQIDFFCFPRIL